MPKLILDTCCGSKMFWFDKETESVVFGDTRIENHTLCDGRTLNISPDIKLDFRFLPFNDSTFKLVVFDPPHLKYLGKKSWMAKKYGILNKTWKHDIKSGFNECMRVVENYGVLIFKWNETQIRLDEILRVINQEPLFGNKRSKTHWLCFMKF